MVRLCHRDKGQSTGMRENGLRTIILTVMAMVAFAANSLICRAALASGLIDAGSFTAVRVVSGAVILLVLIGIRADHLGLDLRRMRAQLPMAVMLFTYMLCFSLAYLNLNAASGALVLFGSVQLTMVGTALLQGERFGLMRWFATVMAVSGLVVLLLPGATAPPLNSALMMALAGVAWGVYSLLGRQSGDPVVSTANNFVIASPLAVLAWWLLPGPVVITASGLALALISGIFASAIGYVIWYAALKRLPSLPAATVQLSVPVIAALGGVLILSEPLSLRLTLASMMTLGGITLILIKTEQKKEAP